jgi:asparagine synthetase B (glutamine-hydrolysing)
MCGIWFSCSFRSSTTPNDQIIELLQNRGPDSLNIVQKTVRSNRSSTCPSRGLEDRALHLVFVASVLSLRGASLVTQPLLDDASGSVLCWNGEAWKLDGKPIYVYDAGAVFKSLLAFARTCPHGSGIGSEEYTAGILALRTTLDAISGPYSFLFYDGLSQRVFCGRDPLGRRSLLIKSTVPRGLVISSISDGPSSEAWEEVEPDNLYVLDLARLLPVTKEVDQRVSFENALILPVKLARMEIPTPHSSSEEPSPSNELQKLTVHTNRRFRNINRDVPNPMSASIHPDSKAVTDLHQNLHKSLELRVGHIPRPPASQSTGPRLAVLFSGGVDCSVLARMIHDILPQDHAVDLLNVAFENPRVVAATNARSAEAEPGTTLSSSPHANCPDRITGTSTFTELLDACPGRLWRFVSIDITYSEVLAHRSQVVSLIHPHDTEMDLSIAYALYFAARGRGYIRDPVTKDICAYTTPARILVSGLGADELFGGYTRHTVSFSRGGYQKLCDELQLDFNRLGKRNLGRDDRVISHWGREARYPYLDEDFVSWALELPVYEKCNFRQDEKKEENTKQPDVPLLEPNKHILRLLAWKLGMKSAAGEKKRAIQFGARTAKMIAGRTKGTKVISL